MSRLLRHDMEGAIDGGKIAARGRGVNGRCRHRATRTIDSWPALCLVPLIVRRCNAIRRQRLARCAAMRKQIPRAPTRLSLDAASPRPASSAP